MTHVRIHTAVYSTWGWVQLDGSLTDEHPRASYGYPVLVIDRANNQDNGAYAHLVGVYGTGDRFPATDRHQDRGQVVHLTPLHLDAPPATAEERAWLVGAFSGEFGHHYRAGSRTTGWIFGAAAQAEAAAAHA